MASVRAVRQAGERARRARRFSRRSRCRPGREESGGALPLPRLLGAGAVFLPLNTAYTDVEVAYFVEDAEPKLIVCDPARREAFSPQPQRQCATVETLDAGGAGTLTEQAAGLSTDFATAFCWPNDTAAILYTSGTTGRSKGAMLSHENLASNAAALVDAWRFTPHDVLLHALPIYHTHGLFVAINTVMLSGGSMIFLPKFDAGELVRLMPKATGLMGVPTFYTRLLKSRPDATGDRPHAPVHLRIGAASCRNASGICRANRPRHPRTLWHDRDRNEHVEPL